MNFFSIKTLGCKVNQYDSQLIREQFLKAGWQESLEENQSDLQRPRTGPAG